MPAFSRPAFLPTAVLFLAAGYALRALVGVVPGEPAAGLDPDADVEQQAVDPVLVPVRDVADPASEHGPHGLVWHPGLT